MKRVYQKPALEVVAFEMNEAIASCNSALGTSLFADVTSCTLSELGEWYVNLGINFTGDNSQCSNPTYDYCYYTSVSTETSGLLASS